MSNAANVEQIDRLKNREEYDRRVLMEAGRVVLGTLSGRIWTNFIIENLCKVSMDGFSPDASIHAYNAGTQSVGKALQSFILQNLGAEYLKKLSDQRFGDLAEVQITREMTDA